MKPVLRYPGGKYRAIESIVQHIPNNISELCSPFFGGGSIELWLMHNRGILIHGYDWFKPLVNFWQSLYWDRYKLTELIQPTFDMGVSDMLFRMMQKSLMDISDPFIQAASFFILNRTSFSGLVLNGGKSVGNPRFTQSCIDRLSIADNIPFIQYAHFKMSIKKHDCLIYADPPYYIQQRLYGERDKQDKFNHMLLAKLLNDRGNFILSYNDCVEIRLLYNKHNIISREWKYGIGKKNSNELLIISKDLC